jgi:hypothetical protein
MAMGSRQAAGSAATRPRIEQASSVEGNPAPLPPRPPLPPLPPWPHHPDMSMSSWAGATGRKRRRGRGPAADAMGGCYRCVSGLMTGETTGMLAIGCQTFDSVVGDMESLAQRPATQQLSSPEPPPPATRRSTRPSTRPAHMSSRQPSRGPGRGDVAESSRRAAGRCGMHLCSQDEAMARCKDANSCTTCVP